MKFPIISTVAIAMCALAATAQAELKIAAVSMQDLYKSYYKRFDAESRLASQKQAIENEIKDRSDKIRVLAEELNKIKQKADPSLSETAKAKVQAEFSTKMNEAQAAEQEFKSFQQRKQVAFQEMQKREIILILQEIQQIVDEAASKENYDIVVNLGAISPPLGIKIFPFVKKSFDITPEMIKQLNAGAPEGFDPQAELNKVNNGGDVQ